MREKENKIRSLFTVAIDVIMFAVIKPPTTWGPKSGTVMAPNKFDPNILNKARVKIIKNTVALEDRQPKVILDFEVDDFEMNSFYLKHIYMTITDN